MSEDSGALERRERPLGLLLGLVVVVVGIGAAMGATLAREDSSSAPEESSVPSEVAFRQAHSGVCDAALRARAGDANSARDIFLARSHQVLHDLAAAASETDRGEAARLLEAKFAVETSIERGDPALADALAILGSATGRALAATGSADPGPCPS